MIKKKIEAPVLTFYKKQFIASKEYSSYTDFLNGNLIDGQKYSKLEVDTLIKNNYKKGKGEK